MTLPRVQDDLYMAVNGQWQETAVIPPDKTAIGADTDLSDNIRDLLVKDLNNMAAGKEPVKEASLQTAVDYFQLAQDFKRRDALGADPVKPRLAFLESLKTFDQFKQALSAMIDDDYALPVEIDVAADFNDARVNTLYLYAPEPIFPDADLYQNGDPKENQAMFDAWAKMAKTLLKAAGYSDADQEKYVQDALAFDQKTAPFKPTNVEQAEMVNLNNPISWADFEQQTESINLAETLAKKIPAKPQTVLALTKKYIEHVNDLLTADTYPQLQHWLIVEELLDDASYLSDDLRKKAGSYSRFLYHQEEPVNQTKHAWQLVNRVLAEPIGIYYGKKYFGDAAKKDITAMVKKIIAQYQTELQHNTWLSPATRDEALKKLGTMKIKMGYPDKAYPLYDVYKIPAGADLLTARLTLAKQEGGFDFAQVTKPVDRSEWAMPGQLVNACYDPTKNDITFPAGILQPPYYSFDWTLAEKLGGTGCTIGHEISHAFDNNGALFDENGSMKNWWTDADRAAFQKAIDAMIAQFDGRESEGSKINGKLVVSENLADNAGMNVALDLLGKDASKEDLQALFIAYTKSWRFKMRPEFAKMMAMQDVHAPAILRVNVPVMNFDAWYKAFDVTASDKMYLPEDKRLTIYAK